MKIALTILLAALGAAVIAVISALIISRILVRVAMDRKYPEIMKRADRFIAGSDMSREFQAHIASTSKKLSAMPHETVRIQSYDGIPLVGHWFKNGKERRVIVAMHGWRSSWCNDFGMVADMWFENGCSVLFAEQRGQNNSGGEYMGFGLTERYDCRDWAIWVSERCPGTPIYLAGVSMGATTVMMATGLELPKTVHGVMADCGFTSPADIWRHVVQGNLHLPYSKSQRAMVNALCKQKINMEADEYSTEDALSASHLPVLFAHGTDDHFVPVEMTYRNYRACAGPRYLLVAPGADHGMTYYLEKEKYTRAVLDFWNLYDGGC